MAKPTPRTKERANPPKASMKVIREWWPRIGNFLMNATQRSRGGGKMKLGTLITSTRISQSTNSTRKKRIGSATFFQENFTVALRADVNGKVWTCQGNHKPHRQRPYR